MKRITANMNVKFHILIIGSLLLFGCTKSEVADSNDSTTPISFETYIGRDVHTKAASYGNDNLPASVGVYGFYSGAKTWTSTDTPNLWENLTLTNNGGTWSYKPEEVRYWTNTKDNYTFLSYAPYATETNGLVASAGANPTITYTVPTDLSKQIDLLYSNNNKNIHKPNNSAPVTLNYEHALARLSVKAKAAADYPDFSFNIKKISITGVFNTTGSFNLYNGQWIDKTAEANKTYNLTVPDTNLALTTTEYDFSSNSNYFMMIPTDFSTNNAILNITYTITYKGATSGDITKPFPVTKEFMAGNAYSFIFTLQRDETNAIKFTVDESVSSWDNAGDIPVNS